MRRQIAATVDRIEGDFAVLKHGSHEIIWPKEELPGDAKEGMVVTLNAVTEDTARKSRLAEATEILNDVINQTIGSPGEPPATLDEYESLEEDHLQTISKQLEELNNNIKKLKE